MTDRAMVELSGRNAPLKAMAIIVAVMFAMLSVSAIVFSNDSDAESRYSEDEFLTAVQEELDRISAEYDEIMQSEYGISYAEYVKAIEYLDGKAICISTENGEIVVNVIEAIEKGKTMTDSTLHGDYLRVYIDSVTLEKLGGLGEASFSAAILAIIGSVVGPIGTAGGILIGWASSELFSELYDHVTQMASDSGIWIDVKVRGHFSIFGHDIYYPVPPTIVVFGPQ